MTLPPLDSVRARDLVQRFHGRRVLIVGDPMLDRFIVGRVTRISPEAPVPVLRFQHEYARLGGAANVAHNLAALGAEVALVGVVGADQAAGRLREALGSAAIGADDLVEDATRPTVEKVRLVTDRHQHVARVDYEDDLEARGAAEAAVVELIGRHGSWAEVLLVSDYLKGSVTASAMHALVAIKASGTPLVVDPKIPHLAWYAGASVITPNHQEAEEATHRRVRTESDARAVASAFRKLADCEATLITRGDQGMWLSSDDADGAIAASAREVSDVTGAGDTVVATLALALAAGATLTEGAVLANQAAGVVVGKFGPASVTAEELLATFTDAALPPSRPARPS